MIVMSELTGMTQFNDRNEQRSKPIREGDTTILRLRHCRSGGARSGWRATDVRMAAIR